MSLSSLLTYSVIPQRHTPTPDGIGGIRKAWTDLGPAVAVRPQDAKSEIKRRYGSDSITVTHTVFTEHDGMQVGDRFNEGQVYWLIRGIRKRRALGSIGDYFLYDCEEIMVRKE